MNERSTLLGDRQTGHPWWRHLDGRWVVVAMLVGYFGLFARLAPPSSPWNGWRALGVPSMRGPSGPVPFGDTVFVLAMLDCHRSGVDVYRESNCDPWGRRMNYPRLWLWALRPFPVTIRDAIPIGVTIGIAFLAGALLYLGRLSGPEGLFVGLLLCSRSLMLGVERGNTDLVIFLILAGAVLASERTARTWLACPLVFAGGLLKFFPIAGLAIALREPRRRATALVAGYGALWVLYLALTWQDVTAIRGAIDRSTYRSYGGQVLYGIVTRWLRDRGFDFGDDTAKSVYLVLLLSVVIASFLAARKSAPAGTARRLDGFRVGAAIYAATYVLLTNYDYKQVFLLLALPQLFEWARSADGAGLRARAALLACLVTFWLSALRREFPLGEALNLLLFAYACFELTRTLPDWTRRRLPDRVAA